MEGADFLKKKYGLQNSPEVASAAKRTEAKEGHKKVNLSSNEGIENYLARFKEIIDRKDPAKREQGIQALKEVVLEKFVTKYEEIPESWHALNERIVRERGQGGDWDRYSGEQKENERRRQAEAVLADQTASLEQWIDYMASEDSSYMPDYIKYWVFRSITDLSEYDKERGEFPKRSKGTVKMFPDINHEALAYVIDAILKKQEGTDMDFGQFTADLTDSQKEAFKKVLVAENFAKLYGWANEQIHPIAKHLLPVTEGVWVKYDQDTDGTENYKLLNSQIRGRGTGWCTAGENTAKTQLQGGDFYVYYTKDDEGDPLIPRIAIRMEDEKIAEVRGIAFKQNLDPYMGDVLAEKLEEFPDKEEYLKKDADMKRLTEVERKAKKGEPLSKEDLVFLYEIDSKIQGFGYNDDPRIKELRQARNTKADISVLLDISQEKIATSPEEIRDDTKMYVGALFSGIFQKGIEQIYTSFPENKLVSYEIELGTKTKEEYQEELSDPKYRVENNAEDILNDSSWSPTSEREKINLVYLTVKDLGFAGRVTTEEIYAAVEKLGLELCPTETALVLLPKLNPKDYVTIGMEPMLSTYSDHSCVFTIDRDDKFYLDTHYADPQTRWDNDSRFVFRLRKVKA